MKKYLMAGLAATLCLASTIAPASAYDGEDPATSILMLPVRVAALGTGIVIGAPVSTIKQTAKRIPEATTQIADSFGGADEPIALTISMVPGIAIGTFVGTVEGVGAGVSNAANNFHDKPFSPESFSLSDTI